MTNHTPGPWTLTKINTGSGRVTKYRIEGMAIMGPFSITLADPTVASVMAAAPDMLAALELCKQALENVPMVGEIYDQQHSDTQMTAIIQARGAIAKAKQ